MDRFSQWAKDNKTTGKLVSTMLQTIPMSCKAKEKLEDYNEEGKLFVKRLHPPIDLTISRPGQPNRDYKVWAYEITDPGEPNQVVN